MFNNYFKNTIRNLAKHKTYSIINVTGLAIGMACCLLILLYVRYELSFGRYHEHAESIYRLASEMKSPGTGDLQRSALTAFPVGPAVVEAFPEVQKVVRFRKARGLSVGGADKHFTEVVFFSDPNVFKMFSFELLQGNREGALQDPYSVVITENTARKYFGEETPIGKVLTLGKFGEYKVTAILQQIPENSHFTFDILASIQSLKEHYSWMKSWWASSFYTYCLLRPDRDPAGFATKLPALVEQNMGEEVVERWGVKLFLQPLTDIHLHSDLSSEIEPNSSIVYIYIFSAVAFLVLIIACLNFMNLSTARSTKRAKEVGVRKVVGAFRSDLIKQFLGEALILAFLALLLSLLMVELALPNFRDFTGRELSLNIFQNIELLSLIVVITLFVGIFSGSYPAFFLSSFKPIGVLQGTLRLKSKRVSLRSILVVAQFVISIALIISTGVVFKQLDFIRNKRLGFHKDQMIIVPSSSEVLKQKYDLIRSELLKHPDILGTAASSSTPGRFHHGRMVRSAGVAEDETASMRTLMVGYDFINTYELEVVAGRALSREFGSDAEQAFILNETAVCKLGWPSAQEAIGKELEWSGEKKGRVIGVVKDFHFESLYHTFRPLMIHIYPNEFKFLSVKVRPQNMATTLQHLENVWHRINPDQPFSYTFLAADLGALYRSEKVMGELLGYFSMLAIFVACLGLFGLALFAAEQRTKEIGIRKVLGASVAGIVLLLSKEFSRWVLAANLLAWPIVWYAMNRWLQGFAYRIDISWWVFVLAGGLALLTVSTQAIRRGAGESGRSVTV